jgi:hypothetical protein
MCHTPRNGLGITNLPQEFAGVESEAPAINPDALSSWTRYDFVGLLQLGMTASFDFVGGEMEDVVKHNTSMLTEEDQEAYAAFFIPVEKEGGGGDFNFD